MADAEEKYEAAMQGEQSHEQRHERAVHTTPPPKHKKPQPNKPTLVQKLKAFLKECVRVYKVTKKPDKQEFTTIVKISGLGILVIGAIGFLIHLADTLIFG